MQVRNDFFDRLCFELAFSERSYRLASVRRNFLAPSLNAADAEDVYQHFSLFEWQLQSRVDGLI